MRHYYEEGWYVKYHTRVLSRDNPDLTIDLMHIEGPFNGTDAIDRTNFLTVNMNDLRIMSTVTISYCAIQMGM